jgi:hypothetical protein
MRRRDVRFATNQDVPGIADDLIETLRAGFAHFCPQKPE